MKYFARKSVGRSVAVLGLTLGSLGVAGLALGNAGGGTSPAERPAAAGTRVVQAHPYRVDSSVGNALAFFDNRTVFEATVVSTGPAVRATDVLPSGTTFEAVYTPVVVRVEQVYRGPLQAGRQVTLRAMGGEADGLRYVMDEAPAKQTFAPGRTLVVFGGDLTAVDSEREPAITPNFLYRLAGTDFVDATYGDEPVGKSPRHRMPATTLRERLQRLPAR